jgi:hypothetical protein
MQSLNWRSKILVNVIKRLENLTNFLHKQVELYPSPVVGQSPKQELERETEEEPDQTSPQTEFEREAWIMQQFGQKEPPSDWLEKVRKNAPHLLRREEGGERKEDNEVTGYGLRVTNAEPQSGDLPVLGRGNKPSRDEKPTRKLDRIQKSVPYARNSRPVLPLPSGEGTEGRGESQEDTNYKARTTSQYKTVADSTSVSDQVTKTMTPPFPLPAWETEQAQEIAPKQIDQRVTNDDLRVTSEKSASKVIAEATAPDAKASRSQLDFDCRSGRNEFPTAIDGTEGRGESRNKPESGEETEKPKPKPAKQPNFLTVAKPVPLKKVTHDELRVTNKKPEYSEHEQARNSETGNKARSFSFSNNLARKPEIEMESNEKVYNQTAKRFELKSEQTQPNRPKVVNFNDFPVQNQEKRQYTEENETPEVSHWASLPDEKMYQPTAPDFWMMARELEHLQKLEREQKGN